MKTLFHSYRRGDAGHLPVSRKPFPHTGYLLLLFFLLWAASSAFGAKRYWIATGAGTNNWNTTSHWSTASGGGSGASVPGSSDTAYFDGNGLGRCSIDATVNVKRFEVKSTFTDTIDQNNYTITAGSGGMIMDGGVFLGSSANNITINGNYNNSACAFTSTAATLTANGDFKLTGSGAFLHNNGIVNFGNVSGITSSTVTITTSSSSKKFHKLKFSNAFQRLITISSGDTMTVEDSLMIRNTAHCWISTGTIQAKGDIYINSTNQFACSGTNALLLINGSGTQRMTGVNNGYLNDLIPVNIAKVSTDTLKLSGTIYTVYDWKLTSGIMNAGTSTFGSYIYGGTLTQTFTGNFTGANAFYRFGAFGTGAGTNTWVVNDTIEVKDSLLFLHSSASANIIISKGTNAGIIVAKKHIRYAAPNLSSNTGRLLINGSGTQVIKSNQTVSPGRPMPTTIITKVSTDTLKIDGHVWTRGNWTYNSGIINSDNAVVGFQNFNNVITGSHTLKKVQFNFNVGAFYAISIASGTELTVTDSLLFSGSDDCYLNTGTVNLHGNLGLQNTGDFHGGSATIKINGTGTQHIWGYTGAGNRNRLCHVTIDKSSGTLYLHDKICFGTTSYGAGTTFTYTAGTIDPGTSTVIFANTKTITISDASNKLSLYNVTFDGPTYATSMNLSSGDTIVANGTMIMSGDANVNLNTGYYHAKGDITVTNSSTSCNGSGFLWINGTGSQTFTGSGTTGAGTLPNIVINKTSGTLSLVSTISCNGDWTYTQGAVSPGTSNVAFIGTKNLDGQGTSSTMSFYKIATFTSGTRTLTGNLDVNDKLLISASTTLSAGTYTINVGGQWSNNGTWTAGTSTVILDGSGYTKVSKSGGAVETFNNLTMNRSFSNSSTTLEAPVKVNGTLTMTKGKIKTTRVTAYFELADNALVVGGHDSAYVHGAMRKTGNDTVWFPLGDTTLTSGAYHPLRISAPSSATDQFEAEYLAKNPGLTYQTDSLGDTLQSVSSCDYWKLQRLVGSSNVIARVTSNDNATCKADDYAQMRVAGFDETTGINKWRDLGGADIKVYDNKAFVSTTAAITLPMTTNPMPITMAKKQTSTVYAVLRRKLDGGYFFVTNGNLYFRYDEEYNDTDGKLTFNVYNSDDNSLESSSTIAPSSIVPAISYGDNHCFLNCFHCQFTSAGSLTSGYYILEVINEKNEKWYLRFKNTNTLTECRN